MAHIMNKTYRFKIALVGDASVGKTTFLIRHLTGDFKSEYVPTMGVDVFPLRLWTNYGMIIFDMWDCGSDGLRDGYYTQAQGAVLMFDVTKRETYDSLENWHSEVSRVAGDIPFVVCGNKVDVLGREVSPRNITFHREHTHVTYYDISAKSNYNYEKPFLSLARSLTGREDLEFVCEP